MYNVRGVYFHKTISPHSENHLPPPPLRLQGLQIFLWGFSLYWRNKNFFMGLESKKVYTGIMFFFRMNEKSQIYDGLMM